MGARSGEAMWTRERCNALRDAGSDFGFYESYFVRANHPTRPWAFWIRYTLFVPRAERERAVGQLWAVFFDGEAREVRAVKQAFPLAGCRCERDRLDLQIGGATLNVNALAGEAQMSGQRIGWRLRYASPHEPLLLLPAPLYEASFPRAKALVAAPLATFDGELHVADRVIAVDGWIGSQNHNWGERHTDRYAWGQVAGFDTDPSAFLECATASVRLGPLYTPRMTPLVLRYQGEEYRHNGVLQSLRARAHYAFFEWKIRSRAAGVTIEATFRADAKDFVALAYENPPGGVKTCLNSKIARCELSLQRPGHAPVQLTTAHRAAFEILTDRLDHGVPMLET